MYFNKTVIKSFQSSHNLQLYWKRTSSKFLPEDIFEKNWYEKVNKIHPKEIVMKSFFS